MSLRDLACYTLSLIPSSTDPKVVELVETVQGKEQARFARVRERREGEVYTAVIYGMVSDFTEELNIVYRLILGCSTRWMWLRDG